VVPMRSPDRRSTPNAAPRPPIHPDRRANARPILTLAFVIAGVMVLSSLAVAGAGAVPSSATASPASSGSAAGPTAVAAPSTPLAATGPMTSLGLASELASSLRGTPAVASPVNLQQKDLVAVVLPAQDPAGLAEFDAQISDLSSPLYGHFLSHPQFARTYGPPLADQQGVANYLASRGLTPVYLSADHTTIGAQGTLAQIQQAFGVTFGSYSSAGQTYFAPRQSPSLPASLAPYVQNVVGLTNFNFGYAPQLVLEGSSHADTAQAGSGVQDYPNQMTYEFGLNQLWNSTGNASAGVHPSFAQGVVLATGLWDLNSSSYCPYSLTDIDQFFHGDTYKAPYGMPQDLPNPIDHANYNVTGDPGTAPGTGNCTSPVGGANVATEELDFEMTIDQEWSGEDAPGAMIEPTYVGGEGVTVSDADLTLLENYVASGNIPGLDLFSQSFGGGENSTSWETDYEEMAATGITVLASSGDNNGASGFEGAEPICDTGASGEYSWNTQGTPIVNYPGSSPNVLSVGGTANMATAGPSNASAILPGQTVWNWCPSADSGESAGSTGGVSEEFTAPSYQTDVPVVKKAMQWAINVTETGNFTNGTPPAGCEGCADGSVASADSARAVPDIAGPAAMNTGYMSGGWVTGFGGTSFSSPSVAGMLGSIVAYDGHRLGFVNPALYQLEEEKLNGSLAALPFPLSPTYSVTNYSNAFYGGGVYNTSAGWGVPQAYNLALLLGKPVLATNPVGTASSGTPYLVSAQIRDDQAVATVNVTYLEPGAATWGNASLALTSGTHLAGTWSGAIPAPSVSGILRYCVDATDRAGGNSWSPYNQSAWAATDGKNLGFGCTVPFTVTVHSSPPPTYAIEFEEHGLPSHATWSVTLTVDGAPLKVSTTKGSITFYEPNGEYAYSIVGPAGYHITKGSPTGTVTVDNKAPAKVQTTWKKTKSTAALPDHLAPPGRAEDPVVASARPETT
jgi:subtilase family serine protease